MVRPVLSMIPVKITIPENIPVKRKRQRSLFLFLFLGFEEPSAKIRLKKYNPLFLFKAVLIRKHYIIGAVDLSVSILYSTTHLGSDMSHVLLMMCN